jgi:hypothetical protein
MIVRLLATAVLVAVVVALAINFTPIRVVAGAGPDNRGTTILVSAQGERTLSAIYSALPYGGALAIALAAAGLRRRPAAEKVTPAN